jgi:tetratricopeptide (TPR) repeat protein
MRLEKWVWLLLPIAMARGGSLPGWSVLDNPAFDHFYNLEYDQALAGFVTAAAQHPESATIHNHIAQTILYRAMFREGMLQTEMLTSSNSFLKMPKLTMSVADQSQFTAAIECAMELAQSRLNDNPDDAEALYALGVSYELQGQYNFIVRKAYLDALHDITRARKFHERVTRIEPGMVDAELTQGVYEYVLGSLRFGWKMLGFLGGFEGNRARGIATINRVAGEGNINRIEAAIVLAAIYRREHRPADAICILKPLIPLLPRNYLLRLELAGIYADQGDRAAALDVLDQVERLWHARAPGYEMLSADLLRMVREQILMDVASNGNSVRG